MNRQDKQVMNEWLAQIGLENSGSENTKRNYRLSMKQFCEVNNLSLFEIAKEWDSIDNYTKDKVFKKKVKKLIKLFEISLEKQDYTKGTIGSKLSAIYSFFNKYLDVRVRAILPQPTVVYHNRPIEKHEIQQIIAHSSLRNQLVYCLMVQSGLRPTTISQLKYKDIKEDYEANIIPLRIVVRKEIAKGKYGNYYTFAGEETAKLLHRILRLRELNRTLNSESYIIEVPEKRQRIHEYADPKSFSHAFEKTITELKLQPNETKNRKPKPLRLYNLRKYFRNRGSSAGLDYIHFWMGHKLQNNDEHYFDKDTVEVHRERYRKFVLPHVRISEQVVYKKVMNKEDLVNFLNTEEGKEAIGEIINKEIQRAFNNAKVTELPNATKTEIELFP